MPTDHSTDSKTVPVAFTNGKDDGSNLAQTINAILNGQGVGPDFHSDHAPGSTLDFGSVPQASTKSLFLGITNDSTDPNAGDTTLTDLTLVSAQLSGSGSDLFSIVGLTAGTVLHEGDPLNLEIKYNGTGSHGPTSALLTIITDQGAMFGGSGDSFTYPITITLGPEPSSLAMLAGAATFFGGAARRRRRKPATA